MRRFAPSIGAALLAAASVHAQQPAAQGPQPYMLGNPLGLPINPSPTQPFQPISPNVKVYGAIYSAESCSYDADRGVIVVPNRGVPQNVQANNAWISFLNHDGSVHTARWIGMPNNAIAGTPTVPPPMPIMVDTPPIPAGNRKPPTPRGNWCAMRRSSPPNVI